MAQQNLTKVYERIRKLYTLQHDKAASQGEKDNCGVLIEKLLVQYNLRIEQVVPEAAPKQKTTTTQQKSQNFDPYNFNPYDASHWDYYSNNTQSSSNFNYEEFLRRMQYETIFGDEVKRAQQQAAADKERARKERAKKAQEAEKKRKEDFRKDYFGDAWDTLYESYIYGDSDYYKKTNTRIARLSDAEKIEVCKWWNAGKSLGEIADKLNAYDSVIFDTLIELGFQVEKPAE